MVYTLHQDDTAQNTGSILIRAPFPVLLFLKDHRVTLLNDSSFSTMVIINWNNIFCLSSVYSEGKGSLVFKVKH